VPDDAFGGALGKVAHAKADNTAIAFKSTGVWPSLSPIFLRALLLMLSIQPVSSLVRMNRFEEAIGFEPGRH
jgi:hypothetical protein